MTPTPTPSALYEELVAKIAQSCPEKIITCSVTGKRGINIGLEDVLRAMPDHSMLWETESGFFRMHNEGDIIIWHLGLPLSEQSPETIAFLHSLLV